MGEVAAYGRWGRSVNPTHTEWRLRSKINSAPASRIGTRISGNDERLTAILAERIMGWKVAPDRFVKSGRKWIPKWRFAPLSRLDDAFQLLDRSTSATYTLERRNIDGFSVNVRCGNRVGRASGEPKARAITLALARALGIETEFDA